MGLAAVPLDGVVLITARAEVPDDPEDRDAWAAARSDGGRRTAPTPPTDSSRPPDGGARRPPGPSSAGESPEPTAGPTGLADLAARRGRLARPGPSVTAGRRAGGAGPGLVRRRRRSWRRGPGPRRRPAMARAVGARAGRGRGLGRARLGLARAPSTGDRALPGAAGRRWPSGSAGRSGPVAGPASSRRPRPRRRAGGAGPRPVAGRSALVAGARPRRPSSAAGPERGPPILALLARSTGRPTRRSKPDRVVLLARGPRAARAAGRARSRPRGRRGRRWSSASHRVGREEPGLAAVESRYEVEVDGDGPGSWSFPVGPARDLSATVDDRPGPAGDLAGRALGDRRRSTGPGVHSVRFRRLGPALGDRAGGRAVPAADQPGGVRPGRGRPRRAGPLGRGARGGRAGRGRAGGIAGALGPVDVAGGPLVRRPIGPRPAGLRGPVEATFLWDARPVGDLIRIRLTHSDPEGASTIRLALEPGLLVRRFSIPDVVGIRRRGDRRPARVGRPGRPALAEGRADRGRLLAAAGRRAERPPAGPGSRSRRRRGSRAWSGSGGRATGRAGSSPGDGVEPLPGGELRQGLGDAARRRPDPGRRGPVRPGRRTWPWRPARSRPGGRSGPGSWSTLEPGRLDAVDRGDLADRQGRSFELEVGLPADFRVVRVEADGLVDWQKVGRDRLRLQFDGSEAPDRHGPDRGLSARRRPTRPMAEARTYQAGDPLAPLGRRRGRARDAGRLRPGPVPGRAGRGGRRRSPTGGPAERPGASASTYRVDRPAGLGAGPVVVAPVEVGVSVRSDLTIDPGQVTWTAVVDCDVTGGPGRVAPAGTCRPSGPRAAELEVDGRPHAGPQAEARGASRRRGRSTPDPPIWGRARLVLRSRRPAPARGRVRLPGGRAAGARRAGGRSGRYDLAIANVSGRPIEVAGSPGLQPIDASRYRSDESPRAAGLDRPGLPGHRRALVAPAQGRAGGRGRRAGRPGSTRVGPGPARGVARRRRGESWGRARYDLEPRPGPFLAVPARPRASKSPGPRSTARSRRPCATGPAAGWSRWATGAPGGSRSGLARPAGAGPARRRRGRWPGPRLDQADVPTLISVECPRSVDLAAGRRAGRAARAGRTGRSRTPSSSPGGSSTPWPISTGVRGATAGRVARRPGRVRAAASGPPAGRRRVDGPPPRPTTARLQAARDAIAEAEPGRRAGGPGPGGPGPGRAWPAPPRTRPAEGRRRPAEPSGSAGSGRSPLLPGPGDRRGPTDSRSTWSPARARRSAWRPRPWIDRWSAGRTSGSRRARPRAGRPAGVGDPAGRASSASVVDPGRCLACGAGRDGAWRLAIAGARAASSATDRVAPIGHEEGPPSSGDGGPSDRSAVGRSSGLRRRVAGSGRRRRRP